MAPEGQAPGGFGGQGHCDRTAGNRDHRSGLGRAAPDAPTAVAYLRVSTEEQATIGVSLAAQREAAENYCRLHGLDLAHVFADEGISGTRTDNRPGLRDAIQAASAARCVLIVHSLSRLARSTRDAIDIADQLAKAHTDLVSISEKIDTTSGMGRFFFTTIAALAQLERDQISERTIAALAYKRSRHERVGGHIPLGYDLADDGVHLLENPDEQRVLRRILELRRQGLSSRKIIKRLDRDGLKPKHGGRWHPKVIIDVCKRVWIPDAG